MKKELAETQLHDMLDKIERGEMTLEDEIGADANASSSAEHRALARFELGTFKHAHAAPNLAGLFPGDLQQAAEALMNRPKLSRCALLGGNEVCLPAKRYFVRKSISFACDMQLKKKSGRNFFECGRPGSTTALCLQWPIELVVSSFVVPFTVPICLPDERAIDAVLRVLGGDLLAALNLFL